MLNIRLFIVFLCLHLTLNTQALASIILSSGPSEIDISQDFFIGQTSNLKNEKTSLRLGYFNGDKWAHVILKNPSNESISKFLYFDTLTGKISLYEKLTENDPLKLLGTSGSSIPYKQRSTPSIFASFKIEIPAQSERTYYLNVVSRHNFNSKVFLGTIETLNQRQFQKLSFLDFYAGGIMCLIFYNFFIFSFLKDKNYLYYCFFSGSFMLAILDIHGLLDKLLQPSSFSFSHYLICFSSMALMFAILFSYNFLEFSKFLPKMGKYLKIIFGITFSLFLIGLTPLEDQYPAFFGKLIDFLLLSSNLIFIVCSSLLLKKTSTARFYLGSWVVVAISLMAWFGMTFGILSNNFFTQHLLLYANLGQMLTLSLALAYRIHKLTLDKLEAEERALQRERYQRLVRVLSHDIANSLTIINSYTKKLISPRNLEPNLQRILEKVYFAADNIKNILKNVREEELLVSRRHSIEMHRTNIFETLQTAAIVFEEHLRHKSLELIIDVPENTFIMANKTCFLNNIVNNILSNSIKFSFSNTKIEISSKTSPEQIAIIFKDYGKGMEKNLINEIFFSQKILSSEGTNAEVGHGFGAILMREYVELFGGKLLIHSILAEEKVKSSGTTITLVFPNFPHIEA